MEVYIRQIRKEGDTVGGIITCVIQNVSVGLGEPAFDKLHAELGKAMLSINAVKGFEYGSGFAGAQMKGEVPTTIRLMPMVAPTETFRRNTRGIPTEWIFILMAF